jgi:starch phosphorylase
MENNYIFGARVEDLRAAAKTYNPKQIYNNNARIRRVVDTLVNGLFTDGRTGMFRELYDSILEGASWHSPDQYYILMDFEPYVDAKLKINRFYRDKTGFAKQCLLNTANAGYFSSDRTIRQYADEIWHI